MIKKLVSRIENDRKKGHKIWEEDEERTLKFELNDKIDEKTRWQRFGQFLRLNGFLHDSLNDFLYENLNFLYENLNVL